MRRNARIRWLGSEFKSSHRRRRSKKVGNMPFAEIKKLHLLLGAKLFNHTAICVSGNFHKAHPRWRINQKQILHQVEGTFLQDFPAGKRQWTRDFILRSKHWPTTVSDRTLVKRGYLFHPQRDALFESYIYGSRITALHTAQQSLTYHSISSDLAQYQIGPCLRESKDLFSLTSTFSSFNF